jgi:predicted amidophosphoribosyltransferase
VTVQYFNTCPKCQAPSSKGRRHCADCGYDAVDIVSAAPALACLDDVKNTIDAIDLPEIPVVTQPTKTLKLKR